MSEVRKNVDQQQFEVWVDDEHVGLLTYVPRGNVWLLPHTEVQPAFEGRGLAGELVRATLDEARAEGVTVIPACPYVARWIERHPDYADLVATR